MDNGASASLAMVSLGSGVSGAAILASGIRFLPGIVLEAFAITTSFLDIIGNLVNRRFAAKASKHEEIRILAESKLNMIHDHILKTLEDTSISADEYKLILGE